MADTITFTIKTLGIRNGKLTAVRVQDVAQQKWYNYDNGVWDNPNIAITPGAGNLYIAAYVQNIGNGAGQITLIINVSGADLYIRKNETVQPGGSFGAEGTWDMPNNDVSASITVNDT